VAVITLGATDELTVLRAYESGSDHHLAEGSGYLLLRAVLTAIMRRTLQTVTRRQLHVGDIHIDQATRNVTVAGNGVDLSRLEFELLVKFAGDPLRVFSKHDSPGAYGADTSTSAPSTATSADSAPASPTPAPKGCSSTHGAKAGRSPPRTNRHTPAPTTDSHRRAVADGRTRRQRPQPGLVTIVFTFSRANDGTGRTQTRPVLRPGSDDPRGKMAGKRLPGSGGLRRAERH
jgi:hypothetical protein